jgi:predicted N-acetyltransferase YhbS
LTDLAFRVAGPDDVPALHRLIESAYRGDSARQGWSHEADILDGQRTDAEELSGIIGDPAQLMLMAHDGERLIGCVRLVDEGEGVVYLGMLSIDPTLQAGGLGRRLMAEAEDMARTRFGATRMRMTVIKSRHELIAWYQRRGYALTGAEEPFPVDDEKFGLPRRLDLVFAVLEKGLIAP